MNTTPVVANERDLLNEFAGFLNRLRGSVYGRALLPEGVALYLAMYGITVRVSGCESYLTMHKGDVTVTIAAGSSAQQVYERLCVLFKYDAPLERPWIPWLALADADVTVPVHSQGDPVLRVTMRKNRKIFVNIPWSASDDEWRVEIGKLVDRELAARVNE
jgi:hypothetical protein